MRVDAEVRAKLDQGMHALLRNPRIRPGDPVQVLLTIRGAHTAVPQALTQAERAATLEDAFRRDAEPLIRDLEQRRAKKVQALWLIRAVSVTMSLAETLEVARNSVIEQVTLDVPRRVLFGDSQGENDE